MTLIILCMMGALIWQLSNITLAEGAYYAEQALSRSTKTTYTTGARGRILDRNGIPLAYDETSYNVQFMREPERLTENSALYTESLIRAIKIIEDGGGTIIDTFYIKPDKDNEGGYVYDWGVDSEDTQHARYKNFCDAMGFTISKANEDKPENWKSAQEAYKELRKSWKIPADMSYEEAKKIMSIRQEVNMNKWRAYEPVTIAYDVSMGVVAKLDMQADELMGISTIQSTTRVYPWGTTTAHIIGYMSRQVGETTITNLERMGFSTEEILGTDDIYVRDKDGNIKQNKYGRDLVQMTRLGYSYNDYMGVAGIERSMERYLTANINEKRGQHTIEINKHNTITRELEKTYATNGYDVMLTIDLELQTVVESALESLIKTMHENEEKMLQDEYEKYSRLRKDTSSIKMAETGSIVVMDVKTGRMLAMASYPSFDPSIFLSPIDEDQEALLFGDDSNMPTLNRAIASRTAPGSIFKMATSLAGLMEGAITTTETITDKGRYTEFESSNEAISDRDAPKCWATSGGGTPSHLHANLNVSNALARSCNYFFFTVADRIGINKLNDWANRLGLGSATGVELPGEVSGHVGGQKVLYDNELPRDQQKSSLPSYVFKQLKIYLEEEVIKKSGREATEKQIESCAEKILALQDGSGSEFGEAIRYLLRDELGIPVTLTRAQNWVNVISSTMLTELKWKPVMTVRTGMGQGIMVVTPVAVARYAAAFANGGTVYDVHVVDRIIDDAGKNIKVYEPSVFDKIDAPDEYWQAIRDGLASVVSDEDGTASRSFSQEFVQGGYQKKIYGKSGSAQISAADNNVDIENTSWFVTYMPREDPEIVVITCIPYGRAGASSIPAVETITRFYLDRKDAAAQENLVQANGLIP